MSKKVAVIAVGGNSLIKDPKRVTVEDQEEALRETSHHIADMIETGWYVAIGHGNGPQVGYILRRSEIAAKVEGMHEVPLDVCGADSQGAIGYEFQQAMQNADLQSEHERYLTAKVTKGPLIVTDYPKEIKAFSMKLNPDGETVAAMDVLVPKVGEIIGGSQREERLDVLEERMKQTGTPGKTSSGISISAGSGQHPTRGSASDSKGLCNM